MEPIGISGLPGCVIGGIGHRPGNANLSVTRLRLPEGSPVFFLGSCPLPARGGRGHRRPRGRGRALAQGSLVALDRGAEDRLQDVFVSQHFRASLVNICQK